jgi:two-component system chemotaxis response regulator CheY
MNAGSRIILIDDNHSWLETLSEYLRGKGFSVLTAADASQGLALLERTEVSLVICDYHMPGMNGLEFVRQLQRRGRHAAVLLVSSDEEPTLIRRALAEGVRAFLAKTSVPRDLLRIVRQLLEARPAPPTLHLWQRLLPGPQHVERKRKKDRPAARSHRVDSSRLSGSLS